MSKLLKIHSDAGITKIRNIYILTTINSYTFQCKPSFPFQFLPHNPHQFFLSLQRLLSPLHLFYIQRSSSFDFQPPCFQFNSLPHCHSHHSYSFWQVPPFLFLYNSSSTTSAELLSAVLFPKLTTIPCCGFYLYKKVVCTFNFVSISSPYCPWAGRLDILFQLQQPPFMYSSWPVALVHMLYMAGPTGISSSVLLQMLTGKLVMSRISPLKTGQGFNQVCLACPMRIVCLHN